MHPLVRIVVLSLALSASLSAHDPGLGTAQIELKRGALVATVGFAPIDLRALLPSRSQAGTATWTTADFNNARAALAELAPRSLEIRDGKGPIAWTHVSVALASSNSILFTLTREPRPTGRLWIRSLVVGLLPPGHRDYISVADERGTVLIEKLLGANDPPVAIEIPVPDYGTTGPPETAPIPTFWGFLWLGITHIWTGYDHLLFLFGLLVVCRSFRSIVGIISCFTVAHSITLALSTLSIVTIPSNVIEPTIAASIFYVGMENLIRRGAEPKGRWALTFGFGLVHGFGFASVLRELGIGSNGHSILMPLFTFNLGVEIGQVSIATIVLPVVWQLRKNQGFIRRGIPTLSAIVALAGLYWFLERTLQ